MITRAQARAHVDYCVDDSLNRRSTMDIPDPDTNVRYVGWQCGAEPMFVAVWSYLPNLRLSADDAAELATDLLTEIGWFSGEPTDPDFIL
jgi:hypothetical protein